MLDGRLRARVGERLEPLGRGLHRLGVTADALTVFGLAAAAVTAGLIANGNLLLAAFGVVLCGLPDLLDGTVARASGSAGPRGAFFDSVADRVTDALLLGGVAWHLGGESAELSVLALGVLALTMLISYERAKAESLGFSTQGGLMERAERMVLLTLGLAFDVLVPMLWLMLALTAVTAVHRFVMVWRQAGAAAAAESAAEGAPDGAAAAHTRHRPRELGERFGDRFGRFRARGPRSRGVPRVPGRR